MLLAALVEGGADVVVLLAVLSVTRSAVLDVEVVALLLELADFCEVAELMSC